MKIRYQKGSGTTMHKFLVGYDGWSMYNNLILKCTSHYFPQAQCQQMIDFQDIKSSNAMIISN